MLDLDNVEHIICIINKKYTKFIKQIIIIIITEHKSNIQGVDYSSRNLGF